jgi:hypothetical protein
MGAQLVERSLSSKSHPLTIVEHTFGDA